MTHYFVLGVLGVILVIVVYVTAKLKAANRKINNLLKKNEALQAEKAVAETKVKHFEVRKKNEEDNRSTSRDDVINRLQQSGDLRD